MAQPEQPPEESSSNQSLHEDDVFPSPMTTRASVTTTTNHTSTGSSSLARMQQRRENTSHVAARRISNSTHSSARNSWMYRQDSQSLSYVSSFANSSISAFELQASNNINSDMQQHRLSIFTSLSGSRYIHDEAGKPIRIPDEAELMSTVPETIHEYPNTWKPSATAPPSLRAGGSGITNTSTDHLLPQSPRRLATSSPYRAIIPTPEDSATVTQMMNRTTGRIPQPPPPFLQSSSSMYSRAPPGPPPPPPFQSSSSSSHLYSSPQRRPVTEDSGIPRMAARFSSSYRDDKEDPSTNNNNNSNPLLLSRGGMPPPPLPGPAHGRARPQPQPPFDYNHHSTTTTTTTNRGQFNSPHSLSRSHPNLYPNVILEDRDFHHHHRHNPNPYHHHHPQQQYHQPPMMHPEAHLLSSSHRRSTVIPRDPMVVPEPVQAPVPPRNFASAVEPTNMGSFPSRRCLSSTTTDVTGDNNKAVVTLETGVVVPAEPTTARQASSYHERCVTCLYCHILLRVAVSTILVQCPDCGTVSPASTNHHAPPVKANATTTTTIST